jgi:anti-sigma factor RsiW
MKLDDIVLMSYVDNELSAEMREQVEQEIHASKDVADRVALLEASRLPYREAFAQQELPAVPASLTKSIEDLIRTHADRPAAATHPVEDPRAGSANDTSIPHDPGTPPPAPIRSRLRVAPAWLAVAFIAGAFFCGVALHFAPRSAVGPATTLASASMDTAPWVQVAASYQQLYSRETVAQDSPDAATTARIIDAIHRDDSIAVRVPDLRAAGMTFVGVQRLRFHGRPLVQLVYLPEKGAPVALCVIKETKPDQAVSLHHINGMDVVTWRQAELGYALIGAPNGSDLAAVGKQIANDSFDQLLGSAQASPNAGMDHNG